MIARHGLAIIACSVPLAGLIALPSVRLMGLEARGVD